MINNINVLALNDSIKGNTTFWEYEVLAKHFISSYRTTGQLSLYMYAEIIICVYYLSDLR